MIGLRNGKVVVQPRASWQQEPVVAPLCEPSYSLGLGILSMAPLEVRERIYGYCFGESVVAIRIECVKRSNKCIRLQHGFEALLYTSRAIYAEAIAVYWSESTVTSLVKAKSYIPLHMPSYTRRRLRLRNTQHPCPLHVVARVLPQVAKKNVRHIRDVTLRDYSIAYRRYFPKLFCKIPDITNTLAQLPRLEQVVLFDAYHTCGVPRLLAFGPHPIGERANLHKAPDEVQGASIYAFKCPFYSLNMQYTSKKWLKTFVGLDVNDPAIGTVQFVSKRARGLRIPLERGSSGRQLYKEVRNGYLAHVFPMLPSSQYTFLDYPWPLILYEVHEHPFHTNSFLPIQFAYVNYTKGLLCYHDGTGTPCSEEDAFARIMEAS